jgi:flagellar hook protein FlgE
MTAQTPWSSVYDEDGDGGAGNLTEIIPGTTMDFTGAYGETGNETPVTPGINGTFTVQNAGESLFWSPTAGIATGTVQDLLDWTEYTFRAEARIDEAGRLTLTDWVADTSTRTSALAISGITYSGGVAEPFGSGEAFEVHPASVGSEDGSQMGDVVSNRFRPEALSTTQYANSSTTIFQDQDGFSSGFLQSVSVDTEGVITGHYSNGQVIEKVQVALANFSNLHGLFKAGGNIFTETTDSGAPTTGAPGDNGLGGIAPNSLEMSNVDLGAEFVKLITVQRGFQANSKIITTTDDMLNDLINIKR